MNPWIEINKRSIRAMLQEARKHGAVRFEAYTDDGEFEVLTNDKRIVDVLTSVDLSALVCVNADGHRWGHFQLVIGQDAMVSDFRFNSVTEKWCEAVADAAAKVEEEFNG